MSTAAAHARWTRTTLGEVLEFQRGFDITRSAQREGRVPVISSGGPSSWHNVAMSKGPGVVIGRKGSLGGVYYAEGPYWPHDTTLWVRDFKGSHPRFVYYFLKTLDTRSMDVGSANPALNRNHLHPLQVRWPTTTALQVGIAQVLGALDDKIAANARLIATADQLAAAWFAALKPVGSGRLADVATVNAAGVRPTSGSLRYLDIASVGVGTYEWPSLTPWVSAPGRARRRIDIADTVWSTVRPNRRSHALVLDEDPEMVGSTGLAVLKATSGGWALLYEMVRTEEFADYLVASAEGSAYPAVHPDRFLAAPVPVYSKDDQMQFESVAQPVRLRMHAAALENRSLAELRDTLLPALMSGQLTVREAERQVEAVV